MPPDRSFVERNCAATERIRALAERLTDDELLQPVGEHWTVAIALAHLAFWDRRVLCALDITERDGKLFAPLLDDYLNDVSLPFWSAILPRRAADLAVECADALDRRLEAYPPALLEQVYAFSNRWVERYPHRNEHLDEVDAVLRS